MKARPDWDHYEPIYFADKGCNLEPHCLSCSRPVCRYDDPQYGRPYPEGYVAQRHYKSKAKHIPVIAGGEPAPAQAGAAIQAPGRQPAQTQPNAEMRGPITQPDPLTPLKSHSGGSDFPLNTFEEVQMASKTPNKPAPAMEPKKMPMPHPPDHPAMPHDPKKMPMRQ